jgi:branched-chain amino acid aminotransferase
MLMTTAPYDQREGFIWWNGKLIAWNDARLHVLTHGLHYASAVFEGMRAYDGDLRAERARSASGRLGQI